MTEQASKVAGVAQAFAELSAKATASANAERLRIAEGNIQAGVSQLELQEKVQRRAIARAYAQHQGAAAASAAFRGTTSTDAPNFVAANQAAESAAIVSANRVSQEAVLRAQQQVILDDPFLAGIQGAIQGIDIGTSIVSSLIESAETVTRQTSTQIGTGGIPTFSNIITQSLEIPGFDLSEFLSISGLEF